MMEAIAGRDDRDRRSLPETGLRYLPLADKDLKGVKVGWTPDLGYAVVDPEVVAGLTAAVGVFESLGAVVEVATLDIEPAGLTFAVI